MHIFQHERSSANRYFWLLIAVLVLFGFFFFQSHTSDTQIQAANERRLRSYILSDELRQTSDDLTRMARTYVATGDLRHKLYYQEILDIRNGIRPTPKNSHHIYWDLVTKDGKRPQPNGRTIAFENRLVDAGFRSEELDFLTQAKDKSDKLTRLEWSAMAIAESQFPSPAKAREQAIHMLNDNRYHQAKAMIMKPISDFQHMVEQRAESELHIAQRRANIIHHVMNVTGLLTLLVLGCLLNSIRKTDQERTRSDQLYRTLFDNTAVGLVHVDLRGRILNVNDAFCQMMGYTAEEMAHRSFNFSKLLFSNTVKHKLFGNMSSENDENKKFILVEPCLGKKDTMVWVHFYVENFVDAVSKKRSYIFSAVNVTEQKKTISELAEYRENLEKLVEERTQKLKASEERFRFIAENNQDVIWMIDLNTESFTYVSPSVFAQRGYTPEELMSSSPWDSLTSDSRDKLQMLLVDLKAQWNADKSQRIVKVVEVEQPHKNGKIVSTEISLSLHGNEKGELTSVLGVSRDITKRKQAEQKIREMAFYDSLTSLPNRQLLFDRLQQSIAAARRRQKRVAVLFIDLDKFKPVNDQFGHQMGDWILKSAAKRFAKFLRPYDTAARIGGDEFVVLLPDLDNVTDAVEIAERIRKSVETPFVTKSGEEIHISTSVGIALFPDHADNEHGLLRVGDDAMYTAKRSGRNKVKIISYPAKPVTETALENDYDTAMKLTWRPTFECGNVQLDTEHRNLFHLANHMMHSAFHEDIDSEHVQPSIEQFLLQTADHFEHEESILFNQSFPLLKEHTHIHHDLLSRAEELKTLALRKEIPLTELIDFFVIDIITQHLLIDDRQYFPYV